MSDANQQGWPDRPEGFYDTWDVFCREVLSALVGKREGSGLASALLAGGAVLGGGGLTAIIAANREAIDEKGKEWGIDNLGTMALGGGALLGAALGGLGGALLTRLLGRHADTDEVDRMQEQLEAMRRLFEMYDQDVKAGRLDEENRRLLVESLFFQQTVV